jgi:hypothetical protein
VSGVVHPAGDPTLAGPPHRLCVAFLDCPTVAKGAAYYLILAQNREQQLYEFAAFDIDRMREELRDETYASFPRSDAERAVVPEAAEGEFDDADLEEYKLRVSAAVAMVRRYVAAEAKNNRVGGRVPEHWLVFTEARFTNNKYSERMGNISLVSLGYWHTWMAPPSALEFIVRMTQAACAEFFLDLRLHYFTKGCLLDFNEYIRDTRLMVLIGSICAVCREKATAAGKQSELAALDALLDKRWVGDTTQNLSVASVLKKVYDYDLYVSRGLSINRLETFWDNLSSSSAQEFIRLIAAVLLAFVLLKFGLKPGG